jgi:hypothetical protein
MVNLGQVMNGSFFVSRGVHAPCDLFQTAGRKPHRELQTNFSVD